MSFKSTISASIFFLMLVAINIFACDPSDGRFEPKAVEDKVRSRHAILEDQKRLEQINESGYAVDSHVYYI